jgi:hypothetical protein
MFGARVELAPLGGLQSAALRDADVYAQFVGKDSAPPPAWPTSPARRSPPLAVLSLTLGSLYGKGGLAHSGARREVWLGQ